jgi:hypothetical protein
MPPHTTGRLSQVLLASAVAFFLSGCGTTYDVKVDAISKPAHDPTATAVAPAKEAVSYTIQNKNPAVDSESLRYKEAAEYVKTALSGKGLYEAPSLEKADMIVEVDFGIDTPRTKMEESTVPVYAQVGGGVRYEEVSVAGRNGTVTTRTVPVFDPPRTELVGYQDVITPVTVYDKYLRLSARENKETTEGKPPAEIWSVNVSTEDESKDLRKYLPLLASASVDYIGKDSNTQKTIKLKETDPGVGFIRKGM